MSELLKPCPWCGSSASMESDLGKHWFVQCDDLVNCGRTDGAEYKTIQEANAAWKTRAPTPPAPKPITDEDIMRIAWVNGLLGFSNWNYSPAQSCPSSVLSFAKALLAAQEGK